MINNKIQEVCRNIKESSNTLVLTGAGISTESGIPDFRSQNTGLWEKIDPMEVLSTSVLFENPQKFYKEGYSLLLDMEDVQPNKGHVALAKLEEMGLIKGIITQNIDSLHQKAGSKKVLEVHGHIRTGTCLDCKSKINLRKLTNKVEIGEIPPICDKCGGLLRPDVVMFGDRLPDDFDRAQELIQDCELLIVVGSSLSVAPVSFLPQMASKVILINLEPTHFDRYAENVINEKSGIVLTKVLEELRKGE